MVSALDLVRQKGLDGNRRNEILESWTPTQIVEFLTEFETNIIDDSLEAKTDTIGTIFDFSAPADLGGGRIPCSFLPCRLDHVDQLARFAILYAESVRIISPLISGAQGESFEIGELRSMVSDDLEVLSYLTTLIEDGLIKILPPGLRLCPVHFPESHALHKRIQRASRSAIRPYLPDVKITLDHSHGFPAYIFTGPKGLFEHGTAVLIPGDPVNGPSVRAKMTLVLNYFRERLNGIVIQDASVDGSNSNHLITSDLDAEIFRYLNSKTTNERSDLLADGLRHSFPMINTLDIEILREIRNDNYDSFTVYRDAISDCLNSKDMTSKRAIKKAYSDRVLPEVNRLNLAINNSKAKAGRSIARDFVIASAVVTVGLFGGIVPIGLGGLLAAAGGINFVRTNADRIDELVNGSLDHRNNKFYFLWKVRQAARRRQKT